MTRSISLSLVLSFIACAVQVGPAESARGDTTAAALVPAPQAGEWWKNRHELKLAQARKGGYEVVLLGDSITHHWETHPSVWSEFFGDLRTHNLGFSGDRTEQVLWRIANGELDRLSPRALVLMIGTNNTGHRLDPAEDTAAGVKAILSQLGERLPGTKVLLLGVFPRGESPDHEMRVLNDRVNDVIKGYADGERVFYLNINDRFLADDGKLTVEVMPDFLHLSEKGYRIWAEAMSDKLRDLAGAHQAVPAS